MFFTKTMGDAHCYKIAPLQGSCSGMFFFIKFWIFGLTGGLAEKEFAQV